MAKQPGRSGIIQRRTPRTDGWTQARKTSFLAGLAQSCNVAATCRALNVTSGSAYKRREYDPEFARRWDGAIQQGYVRLEMELLQRALGNAVTDNEAAAAVADADVVTMPFDVELALRLMAQRAKAAATGRRHPGGALARPDTQDVLAALDRKLTAMEKRVARKAVTGQALTGQALTGPAGEPQAREKKA